MEMDKSNSFGEYSFGKDSRVRRGGHLARLCRIVLGAFTLTRVTDRRTSLRFEIFGRLRGSLATTQPVRLHDISPGGALVELSFALPVDSQHSVQLASDGQVATVEARVRHVRPSFEVGRFLVGLEFTGPEHALQALGPVADQETV